jgi:hypothetical protein
VDAQPWLEELQHELDRRKLPRRYVARLLGELSNHFTDFMENQMSTDAQQLQIVVTRLGRPSDIADTAVKEYSRHRFAARHPLLTFGALPVVLLPLLWIGFALSVWGLLEVAGGFFGDVPDGPLPRWVEWGILLVVYGTMNVPIVISAGLICRLAGKAFVSRKWLAFALLMLALVASSIYPHVAMKTADRPGLICFVTPYWGDLYPPADPSNVLYVRVPRTARIAQIVQVALPLVFGARVACRHLVVRRYRLAA